MVLEKLDTYMQKNTQKKLVLYLTPYIKLNWMDDRPKCNVSYCKTFRENIGNKSVTRVRQSVLRQDGERKHNP